jgi:hypothetical protein
MQTQGRKHETELAHLSQADRQLEPPGVEARRPRGYIRHEDLGHYDQTEEEGRPWQGAPELAGIEESPNRHKEERGEDVSESQHSADHAP